MWCEPDSKATVSNDNPMWIMASELCLIKTNQEKEGEKVLAILLWFHQQQNKNDEGRVTNTLPWNLEIKYQSIFWQEEYSMVHFWFCLKDGYEKISR